MEPPASRAPSPFAAAFVRWTLRHGRLIWLIALILAVPALWRTIGLYAHLRSELDELLPPNAPSVIAIRELGARMPGLQYLGVVVDAGDAKNLAAAEKLIDDLAARVRTYPPELVRSVRTGVDAEHAFLKTNAPLYLELADLKSIHARLEARRDYEVFGPGLDDDKPPSLDFSDLDAKYKDHDGGAGRFPRDRFSNAEQHTSLLLIEVGTYSTGSDAAHRLLDRVRQDVAALGGPTKYAAGMRVGYTGDVAISVEELDALVSDLTLSSLVVIFAVAAVIILFFRWWRSIPALVAPLLLATLYSFALVTLPPFSIHELNSNTAFLGSIIVGNGINFGIIFLARYIEERRAGVGTEPALIAGVWGSRTGTLSAALAAAVAYGSLVITQFRGFRQFGLIGGIGMVLCWTSAYVLMPPLLKWLDRGSAASTGTRAAGADLMGLIGRFVARFPRAIVGVAVVIALLALVKVRQLDRGVLEYDFSRLRRADTFEKGEGYWGQRMDALLGRYLTPVALLASDEAKARAMADEARRSMKRPPLDEMVASITTADDVLPRDQLAKIDEVAAIRELLTPKIRSEIPADRLADVDAVLGAKELRPIDVDALPSTFTAGLRERDGRIDRAVLVYPRPSSLTWQGGALISFTRELRRIAEVGGGAPALVAGSTPLSADIIESIEHDGPLATTAALLGVIAMVMVMLRRSWSTVLVIGSLLLAVLWLTAAAMALGVKINFANFIAFPITFGIGVDYAVNIVARYQEDGTGDVVAAVRATGGAVGLCSLTTIIGYSSLLLAENRALFSFGVLAVMGEVSCIGIAVIVLPAVLLAARRKKTTAAPTQ